MKRVYDQPIQNTSVSNITKEIKSATFKSGYEEVIDKMIQNRDLKMTEMDAYIKPYLTELFEENIDKISIARISNWLLDNGYLISVEDSTGSNHREASENGKIIGIINTVYRLENNTSYIQYKFTPKGQRFVFENLAEIAVYKRKRESK